MPQRPVFIGLFVSNQLLTISDMKTTARRPTADRREQIAEAAMSIIGERGISALTTASLAAQVGVTTGALYRHFATFEEILEEAVRCGVGHIDATFPDASLAPLARLEELARNRVRLMRGNPGLAWLLRSEEANLVLPARATRELRAVRQRSRRFLLKALQDGITSGDIRQDIEAEQLLIPVLATIHAAMGSPTRSAGRGRQPNVDLVLSTLLRLIRKETP